MVHRKLHPRGCYRLLRLETKLEYSVPLPNLKNLGAMEFEV